MEWKEVKLGDVCVVKGGKRLPKGISLQTERNSHPYIRVRDLGDSKKLELTPNFEYVDDDTQELISRYIVSEGDLILSIVGTIGLVGIIGDTLNNANLTENCVKLTSLKGIDKDFLYYFLISSNGQDEIRKGTVGAVQAKLPIKNILDINISVPSFSDQRRIASILSSLDSKIETNNKINAKLEEMAQALFKSWFVDFEPFKNKGMVESELGMIPEGWRVGKLGDIAEINPKLTLKKGQEATYLDMSAMPTSGSFPKEWTRKEYAGGMKFQNHDTLMARITPCLENGKVAYVDFLSEQEVGFGSTEYIVMRPKNGKLPEFFYFLCRHREFVDYATKNMNGSSGRQRVSGETIGNYSLVLPPESVIESLECVFKGIMDRIKNNGLENLRLSLLRDTLLPKLMSGEIDLDSLPQ